MNATLSFIASPDGGGPDDVPLVVEIISGPGSVKSDAQQAKSNPKLIGSSIGWHTMSYEYMVLQPTHVLQYTLKQPNTQKY